MARITKVITISMFPEDIEALKKLCLIEGRNASNLIQWLVKKELSKREEKINK